MSSTVVSNYLKGKNDPTLSMLTKLGDALGVRVEWLATGAGPMKGGEPAKVTSRFGSRYIPGGYTVVAGWYEGRVAGQPADRGKGPDLAVETPWVESQDGDADDLAVVRVDGDEMAPDLRTGDKVIVDLRRTKVQGEGLFAVSMHGVVVVRRASPDLAKGEIVLSTSSGETLRVPMESDALQVIGRVIRAVKAY